MTAWRSSTTPRFDTLLLVIIAGIALTVLRVNVASSPALLAVRAVCELIVTVCLSFVLRRWARSLPQAGGLVAIGILVVVVYPFGTELLVRQFAGGSEPLELLLLTSVQLAAVVLAMFWGVPRLAGSAVLLSCFLLLFVTTMSSNRTTLVLVGTFGILVLWWLMSAYWNQISGAFVASSVERRMPVRFSVIGCTALVLLLLAAFVGTTGGTVDALPGFLLTSGGTRWHDAHARSGVGDGDATVAAKEEAMSFGPVESELFLDSQMPTLYDMFNDMYGEPAKQEKKRERNIGLAPDDVREPEQQICNTQRSGREFSAVRRDVDRESQPLNDRPAPAMLYVVGRVPLHLALERFDTFDGRVWTHSGQGEAHPPIYLHQENGKPWAYVTRVGASPIHRGLESHALKIINLKTNRFPSPPQLTAVHIDRVDQPDFFGWTNDGVACMPVREHIPQLTVLHVQSQGVNLQSLREADFATRVTSVLSEQKVHEGTAMEVRAERIARYLEVPQHCQAVSNVATTWTRSVPCGWRQVEAVVDRLRTRFTLDPEAKGPQDSSDIVSHFLQSQCGPDYLFATSAAIILRELGYATRLVTGFYADSDRYAHRAGQTAVLAEDVHVWVEVNVGNGTWVPIEPTPGYELPSERLTWRQWAMMAMVRSMSWMETHSLVVLIGFGLALWLFFARRVCLDALAVGVCYLMGQRSIRARLLWTIRLLEWRAWLTGRSRPRQSTVVAWYAPLFQRAPAGIQPALVQFLYWTDQLLYSADGIDLAKKPEVDSACRSAMSACTLKLLMTNYLQKTKSDRR